MNSITTTFGNLEDNAGYRVIGVSPKNNCRIVSSAHNGATKWRLFFDHPSDRNPAADVNYDSPGQALAAVEKTWGWRHISVERKGT
jgi:hypothetical protein